MDRAVKVWAVSSRKDGPAVDLLPGVFRLTYVENTGAAFGALDGHTALLTAVTGCALAALLVYLLLRDASVPRLPRAALWLLLGGALGNLFDRVFYGYVIDMFEFRFVSFPVFNVADACISVAFALLAGWILLGREAKKVGG